MIRIVLHTKVIVSAYLNEDGVPHSILRLALAKVIRIYISLPVLAEYEERFCAKATLWMVDGPNCC